MLSGAGSQSSVPRPGNVGALWVVWKRHLPELKGMRPWWDGTGSPLLAQALSGRLPWKALGAG